MACRPYGFLYIGFLILRICLSGIDFCSQEKMRHIQLGIGTPEIRELNFKEDFRGKPSFFEQNMKKTEKNQGKLQ